MVSVMKKVFSLLLVPALAGCLSSSPIPVAHWPVAYVGPTVSERPGKLGIGRVSQVVVRAPYNSEGISVLRANGTVEHDPYNEFAALPSTLLKGALLDAMAASGKFKTVVNSSSGTKSSTMVELLVAELALDCRRENERKAVVRIVLRVLRDGEIVGLEKGEGFADAGDGNYGAAFSLALSAALSSWWRQELGSKD